MKLLLDMHCHTISSGHAYSTVKEYVDEAALKGLQLIAITDHAPAMPGAPCFMHFWNLKVIPQFINGVEILKGVEVSILNSDGDLDLDSGLLKNLDVVIASLHTPCFEPLSECENTKTLINVMRNPYVNILGHLGDLRYPMDLEKVLDEAKRTNTIIELNNSSLLPTSARVGGSKAVEEIMLLCKKKNIPIIIGSDAHFYLDVGNFGMAIELLNKIDFPESLILNTSVTRFKESLIIKTKGGRL